MNQQTNYLLDALKGFEKKDPRYINLCHQFGERDLSKITSIPWHSLKDPENILVLLAAGQKISKLDASIGKLRTLKLLDLSQNPLEELPKEIGQLVELESMRLAETFEVNPYQYCELLFSGPRHYPDFLSEAGLRDLPEEFGNLQNLQSLQMDSNRFEQIPDSVFNLKNLKSLDLGANLLKSISPKIGQLRDLEYLKLSRNNFSELPESIGELKKLKRLRLDSLHLTTLPESIGEMTKLEMLEICQGKIDHIPSSIQYLTNLRYIYLVDTEVDEIYVNMLKVLLPDTEISFEAGF